MLWGSGTETEEKFLQAHMICIKNDPQQEITLCGYVNKEVPKDCLWKRSEVHYRIIEMFCASEPVWSVCFYLAVFIKENIREQKQGF